MQKTPLNAVHRELGAVLVDFHGWEMPVRYDSIPKEHEQVRQHAGLFDLCHMGRLELRGPGATAWLQRVLTGDVATLKPSRARYSLILNDEGRIIDDVIVYRLPESLLLVVNASNRATVVDWLTRHRNDLDAELVDRTGEWAMIALQGSESASLLPEVMGELERPWDSIKYYSIAAGKFRGRTAWVARTGYTGEDGFEVYLDAADAADLWREILERGGKRVRSIGLGARDTLRLEAGMPLYGNDIDTTTDPYEAGLGFAVKTEKQPPFIGRDALLTRSQCGLKRRLCGFRMQSRRVARHGMEIFHKDRRVGVITSGAPSPTLGFPIAMGYLASEIGGDDSSGEAPPSQPANDLFVDIRGRREALQLHSLPFYSRLRKKS